MAVKSKPTMEQAMHSLLTKPAITLREFSVLVGTSHSTTQRHAAAETLPSQVKTVKIGQRWIIPSVGVRELLGIAEATATSPP